MGGNRNWTDEEVKHLVELFKEGNDVSQISKVIDRSEVAIQTKLNKLGYYINPNHNKYWDVNTAIDLHDRKYSADYISKICGTSRYKVIKTLKDMGYEFAERPKFWNKDREDKLEELILEGRTLEDISEYFGKSKTAISGRIGVLYGTKSIKKAKKFIKTGDF